MIETAELVCEGKVRIGDVAAATSRRLGRATGEWLEWSPEEASIVVRHIQPGGTPAIAAVPSELVLLLDELAPQERAAMTGGTLLIRDGGGILMRLVVDHGEVRIQWPREDWQKAHAAPLDEVLRAADPFSARVDGKVTFAGDDAKAKRLELFVDRFEGLYPEGDLSIEVVGGFVVAVFKGVNVGPAQLLSTLRELSEPAGSLEGELDVRSFASHSFDRDFRVTIREGKAEAVRPDLWG